MAGFRVQKGHTFRHFLSQPPLKKFPCDRPFRVCMSLCLFYGVRISFSQAWSSGLAWYQRLSLERLQIDGSFCMQRVAELGLVARVSQICSCCAHAYHVYAWYHTTATQIYTRAQTCQTHKLRAYILVLSTKHTYLKTQAHTLTRLHPPRRQSDVALTSVSTFLCLKTTHVLLCLRSI